MLYNQGRKFISKIRREIINSVLVRGKQKIFCIGRNKTGTTSLKKAFEDLGFIVGNQREAFLLLNDYIARDFEAIKKYCKAAQVFQDFPFSYPDTYRFLDQAYPNSKFILSIRNSPDQWYESVVTFHSKLFGGGNLPTVSLLKDADYIWKGWIWEAFHEIYKTPEHDPYNRTMLISQYVTYNNDVNDYFRNRKDDFIEINIAERDSYMRLMKFLNIESPYNEFPWANRTADHNVKFLENK